MSGSFAVYLLPGEEDAEINIERSLKLVLQSDAVVCWAYSALVALFSEFLARGIVVEGVQESAWLTPPFFVFLGLFVATVGCYSWWITGSWPERVKHIYALVGLEVLWCLTCLALLVLDPTELTQLGTLFVIASGAGVLAFLVPELVLFLKFDARQRIRRDGSATGGSVR